MTSFRSLQSGVTGESNRLKKSSGRKRQRDVCVKIFFQQYSAVIHVQMSDQAPGEGKPQGAKEGKPQEAKTGNLVAPG